MEQENLNKGTPPPETATAPEVPQPAPDVKPEAKKPAKPTKELTPADMQKRKKMVVMPLFVLIFGAVMWLIFSPSGKDREKEAQQAGLNVELPMPTDGGLVSDKRDAYEQEAMQQKQQERMRSLQDFSVRLAGAQEQAEEDEERRMASNSPDYYEDPSRTAGGNASPSRASAIRSSTAAYQDINKQLGEWYEEPETDAQTPSALEGRMQELERKLSEAEEARRMEDEQAALLEKSYAMAARYMPPQTGQVTENTAASGTKDKVVAQPVKQVRQNVVSLLAAPMSDNEFITAYSKPRNMGFLTAAGNEGVTDKNSIRAVVYQTVTLTNGKELQMRLTEPMRAGDILIPANSILTGACRIGGDRLDVTVNSIEYAGNIIPVELMVYDADGQKGIFIPNNDEINAAKEVAATLANSAGTSIMISDDAGSQLAADMGKGLIQGASQYVSKKMSVVKVTVKANYRLLLLPKNQ
jgi:conjugative transposon TraM protein